MAKRKLKVYERAGIVSIEEVLPLIRDPNIQNVVLCGQKVNVTSLRLQTFAKSCKCSACGLEATFFAVESNSNYHLNLRADRSAQGLGEMLFTHDHTLARSLGGADDESNVTTMCEKCNVRKSRGEYEELCRRKGLPLPSEAKKRKVDKGQSVAASAAERKEENQRVYTMPLEYAVRQFRKRERKAAEAA